METATTQLLFVGSYRPATARGIHAFAFDTTSGDLTAVGGYRGIANPSFLTLHPDGKWLYAVSETGAAADGVQGGVAAFRYEEKPFRIEMVNRQPAAGDLPCHAVIDGNGRFLAVSNYGTGTVAVYPILAGGGLGEMCSFAQHEGYGPNQVRQEGPHAHSAIFSPDNRFLIVADLGIDQLVIYRFNSDSGALVPHDVVQTGPGAGPRHMTFAANGRLLYVAHELGCAISLYAYDAAAGTLRHRQTESTLPAKAPETTVADIHLHPSGKHIYVSNRGHNSIAHFKVTTDGWMQRVAVSSCGGNWPRNFAVAANGRFLLVANRRSNQLSILPLASDSAEISGTPLQVSVAEPACIQFAR